MLEGGLAVNTFDFRARLELGFTACIVVLDFDSGG
jgi:hypothetical protein